MRKLVVAAAAVAMLGIATPASAHVSVDPGEAEAGGFAKVAFRVPTEREVPTTSVEVQFPEDSPLAYVSVEPVPGWEYQVQRRTLQDPIDAEGSEIDEVVSTITWTATGGGIRAGEFQEFDVSVGPLPDSGELVFKTVQTYADGETVGWIEEQTGDVEPEFPAPVLRIGAEKGGTGTGASAAPETSTHGHGSGSGSPASVGISLGALAVSLVALGLVLARRRES